ncbi:MAG: GspE/PulE family protein [Candidatus Magnetoovum sp. WYHC-5]|nr:GspE/PulE family protein [Candidatus Magnetoovum sp. WYHC-5]
MNKGQASKDIQFTERFQEVANRIHAANNVDEILLKLKDNILELFEADRITIYAIDPAKNELYSKIMEGTEIKSIRVPISPQSIAGYTAYALEIINIPDVNDQNYLRKIHANIKFDSRWDQKSGFSTKQILAAPIKFENRLFGVIQLINKEGGTFFTADDERKIKEIARILGIAFRNQSRMLSSNFSYLVSNNIITEDELKTAISVARNDKKEVESVLMESYKVQKKDIGAALGQFFGCKFVEYNEKVSIPIEVAKGLNFSYLRRAQWVPIAIDKSKATVALTKPLEIKVAEIKNVLKVPDYEFVIALKVDILKFIQYIEKTAIEATTTEDMLEVQETTREFEDISDLNSSALVRLANQIIIEGYNKRASDIHIEPNKAKKLVDIRYRIDGVCYKQFEIPILQASALITRIKAMANMNTVEKTVPQEGKVRFIYKKNPLEIQVITIPTVSGEDVVLKINQGNMPIPLEGLGFSDVNVSTLKNIMLNRRGLILVCGTVRAGKTTTIHSLLSLINKPDIKIWTAEYPVKIIQQGLRQVEIRPSVNFNFAKALQSFLRADADVLMVGKLTDYETAVTALEGAMSGHLILSTFYAKDAAETLVKLGQLCFAHHNIAETLLCIVAQCLVPLLCDKCKEAYSPLQKEIDLIGKNVADVSRDLKLYKAKGCSICNNSGYKGRTTISELLVITEDMRSLIRKKASIEEIKAQALKDDMVGMAQDAVGKLLKGYIDFKQIQCIDIN